MTNGKIQKAKCGFAGLLAAAIILAAAVLCSFVRPAAASAETLKVNTETVLFMRIRQRRRLANRQTSIFALKVKTILHMRLQSRFGMIRRRWS